MGPWIKKAITKRQLKPFFDDGQGQDRQEPRQPGLGPPWIAVGEPLWTTSRTSSRTSRAARAARGVVKLAAEVKARDVIEVVGAMIMMGIMDAFKTDRGALDTACPPGSGPDLPSRWGALGSPASAREDTTASYRRRRRCSSGTGWQISRANAALTWTSTSSEAGRSR